VRAVDAGAIARELAAVATRRPSPADVGKARVEAIKAASR
jgi:hypothetical protein